MPDRAPRWTQDGIELAGEVARYDERDWNTSFLAFEAASRLAEIEQFDWIQDNTSNPFIEPEDPYDRELDTFGRVEELPLSGTEKREAAELLGEELSDSGRLVAPGQEPMALYATTSDGQQLYVEYDKLPKTNRHTPIYRPGRIQEKHLSRAEHLDTDSIDILELGPGELYKKAEASTVDEDVTDNQPWKYRLLDMAGLADVLDDEVLKDLGVMKEWEYRIDTEYGEMEDGRKNTGLRDALRLLEDGEPFDTATAYARRVPPSENDY